MSAAVTVPTGEDCPSGAAVEANLERLGALALLAQLGTAAVRVEAPWLHVSFRDHRGDAIGERVLAATADCADRAALVATVLATFAGDWGRPVLAAPPPATPAPVTGRGGADLVATTKPALPWHAELGAMAFGLHDGDVGGFGIGGRADLGRGAWMATALVEGSSTREQALGWGQGEYGFLRAGLGLGLRRRGTRWFADAALVPMVARVALRGRNLTPSETATAWGFVLAGQGRIGWAAGRVRPFLFLGCSYDTPAQWMTLRNDTARVPLSPFNIEGGLGVSYGILP